MRLKVNDTNVPLLGGCITEDINKYYTEVTLITNGCLFGGEVTLEGSSVANLVITGYTYQNGVYYTTCAPKQVFDHLNVSSKPIMGKYTVKALIKKLGYSSSIPQDSSPTFWVMPSMRLKSVIQNLNWYAKFPQGGAVVFFMDYRGFIQCLDLRLAFKKSPMNINGTLLEDTADASWLLDTPGAFRINSQTADDMEKVVEVSNVDGLGTGSAHCFETDGLFATERMKQRLTNQFWYNYYTSRSITISCQNQSIAEVGQCVKVNGIGPFVVAGTSLDLPSGDEMPANVRLRLISTNV